MILSKIIPVLSGQRLLCSDFVYIHVDLPKRNISSITYRHIQGYGNIDLKMLITHGADLQKLAEGRGWGFGWGADRRRCVCVLLTLFQLISGTSGSSSRKILKTRRSRAPYPRPFRPATTMACGTMGRTP